MQRQVLPPHPVPSDSEEFLAWCSPQEKAVHLMAIQGLGSSYFMEKSHGYQAWKKATSSKGNEVSQQSK
jgi:hypothetical protein